MTPSDRLKKIRKKLGLNQEELALSMGLNRNHITSLETQKAKISTLFALALEYIHKVKKEWLLDGKGGYFIEQPEIKDNDVGVKTTQDQSVINRFKDPTKGLENNKLLIAIENADEELYGKVTNYIKGVYDAVQTLKKENLKKGNRELENM